MSIYRYLDEAHQKTVACSDAASLRRSLKTLPTQYRETSSAKESLAGYDVGEARLIALRNAAALATIRGEPDFRERILDQIARFIAEASLALRNGSASAVRVGDFARSRVGGQNTWPQVSAGARPAMPRWADTASRMR